MIVSTSPWASAVIEELVKVSSEVVFHNSCKMVKWPWPLNPTPNLFPVQVFLEVMNITQFRSEKVSHHHIVQVSMHFVFSNIYWSDRVWPAFPICIFGKSVTLWVACSNKFAHPQISNKKGRLLHVYPKQQEKKAKKVYFKNGLSSSKSENVFLTHLNWL